MARREMKESWKEKDVRCRETSNSTDYPIDDSVIDRAETIVPNTRILLVNGVTG